MKSPQKKVLFFPHKLMANKFILIIGLEISSY